MSDFFSNLITNMQRPAELIRPRLGPFYGTSPTPAFPSPDERAHDFAAEANELASEEPASPWRRNSLVNLPISARSSDFSRDAQSSRRHDSWVRPEMDSPQTLEPPRARSMPFQRESAVDISFFSQPSPEMDLKDESPRSPLINQDVEGDDSLRRSAGEETNPLLHEAKAARPMSKLSIPSEREKLAASRGGQAEPSLLPDFHAAAPRREERFAARVPLRSAEVAAPVFSSPSARSLEPMLALPQLRPDVELPITTQNLKGAEKHEPIIRVNIGRIEVRAVTPPAIPRSKCARSGPPLSLEDYLKQRNGGQR